MMMMMILGQRMQPKMLLFLAHRDIVYCPYKAVYQIRSLQLEQFWRYVRSYAKNCRGHVTKATPTLRENYLCARSAFPTQSCTPNLKSIGLQLKQFSRYCALTYWGHELDLSRSRDVIGYVTIRQPIGHFLLVVLWNQASVSNGFRDIQRQM